MTRHRVALLGLPGTGKSTFIGALWTLIDDFQYPHVVELDVRGDRSYVQSLAEKVVSAVEITRTPTASAGVLEVDVEFTGDGPATLSIADRSGEQLRELVEDRHWLPLLSDEIDSIDSILLFVNPSTLESPIPIRAMSEIGLNGGVRPETSTSPAEVNERAASDEIEGQVSASEDPRIFRNRKACTAARLVDGLENLLDAKSDDQPVSVAVVVSAFDLVEQRTPLDWLSDRLPALRAFLDCNPDRVSWTVFGVSAQGGKLPDAKDELLDRGDVVDRCYAQRANGDSTPLSEPVRWAVGWR
ncbi:MAG: hypothetical protein AAGC46_05720 [Solirubrobacteraceae bacterium]